MEQLLVISGMEEPLKLSYEYAVGCRLTPSYCVVSHSRRIRSFLLSHDIPCRALSSPSRVAETPALYDVLVGPVQSPLFQQYLLGDVALERPAPRGRDGGRSGERREAEAAREAEGDDEASQEEGGERCGGVSADSGVGTESGVGVWGVCDG